MATVLAPIRALGTSLPRRLAGWIKARLNPEQAPPVLAPYRPVRTRREEKKRRRRLLTAIGFIGFIYGFLVSIFPVAWYLYMALPILLMGALVVWALPESESYPEAAIERLFFAVFISLFLWPNYLAVELPGLPWITMIRLWAAPLCLVFLMSLSTSPSFRGRITQVFSASPWLLRLMVAFIIIQTLTLPLSGRLGNSFNKFLDAQFAWTTIFFVSACIFMKPGRPRLWATLFCAMAVLLAFLAIPELRRQQVLWGGEIPSFLAIEDERVLAILAGGRRFASGIYRLQSTFGTSLNFAEFLGYTTPFFLYFLATARSALLRLAIIAYLPYSFWVISGTDSRLGVIAFFASLMLYLLLWGLKTWMRRRENLFAPLVVLTYPILAGLFFVLTLVWQRLGRMVWGGGPQQASNEARKQQYASAWPKIGKNPVGNGIGEGAVTLGHTNLGGTLTIDSYYLTIALEYGVLGFFVYYGLVMTGIWQAVKYGLQSVGKEAELLLPCAVMLTVFVIVKGVLAQDDIHSAMFMVLGMVAALTYKVKRDLEARGGVPVGR
jgi:hypothetical protein